MLLATITAGALIGYVALVLCLIVCVVLAIIGLGSQYSILYTVGAVLAALICIGVWWWGMAFTLSSDYHAWNLKQGKVERVAKRLVSTGDKGVGERYVVTINGQPYGIDDTRAALVKPGDRVSLLCKKSYQWGVPREAQGWVCNWNKVPTS